MIRDKLRFFGRLIPLANAILALPAAISLRSALKHGLERGGDFQWSGSHLILNHIDPYLQFLRNDPEHRIILAQNPNYLHELYVLLFPFGMLPFEKARTLFLFVNLLLSVACVLLLGKVYGLDRSRTLLLGLLFAISTPYRITLSSGQSSMLELFFLTLLLATAQKGLWFGFSYFKYSFSPVFFFYFAFQSRWRLLLWSLVAPTAGFLVCWYLLHGDPIKLAFEPMKASRPGGGGVNLGMGDFASILYTSVPNLGVVYAQKAGFAIGIVCSLILAWKVSQQVVSDRLGLAVLVPASLYFLVHLTYDYVLLLIPLASLLSLQSARNRFVFPSLACLAILWFVLPSFSQLLPQAPQFLVTLSACLLLSALTFFLLSFKPAISPGMARI